MDTGEEEEEEEEDQEYQALSESCFRKTSVYSLYASGELSYNECQNYQSQTLPPGKATDKIYHS